MTAPAAQLVLYLALCAAFCFLVVLKLSLASRRQRRPRPRVRSTVGTPRSAILSALAHLGEMKASRRLGNGLSYFLIPALVVQFTLAGLPGPVAQFVSRTIGNVGVITAAAATLAPNVVGTTNNSWSQRWAGKSHLFTMSDGARVVIYLDGTVTGYRILPSGGSWGSYVPFNAPTNQNGTAFTQVGDTIFGASSEDTAPVQLIKLVYSAGAITQSNAPVIRPTGSGINRVTAIYWDTTNAYLHVVYFVASPGVVWLDAYDSSFVNHMSVDVSQLGMSNSHTASLAGTGNSFFMTGWDGTTGSGWVTAVTASASAYTLTPESSIPTLPTQSGAVNTIWDGSNLIFAALVTPSTGQSVQVMTRTAANSYSGWLTIFSGQGMRSEQPALVRKGTGASSDLALLFVGSVDSVSNHGGIVWSLQRISGSWFGPIVMGGGDVLTVSAAPSDLNDSTNIPFTFLQLGGGFCASPDPLCSIVVASTPFGDFGSNVPYTFGFDSNGGYSPDPVNVGTGSFTTQATDLAMPGRVIPFGFVRSYNSADTQVSPLGPGWTHSFYWSLQAGTVAEVRRGDGRRDLYTHNSDGSYTAPPGVYDTLVKNGDSTYTLTLTNQTAYDFSSAGVLTKIREPAGNQITLGYTGSNLTSITDTTGRAVTLGYVANRLASITDPLGRKVTYSYDPSGRLATVTDKIGNAAGQNPALHRWVYGYDGSSKHLTTITDPDGRVRVTNAFDSLGRVYQQLDGKSKLTQFAYTPGQTVVTDPRGHGTTYTFDSRMRILTQSDVVGANTYTITYHYDAAGNRDQVIDRIGAHTDYTYDTRGNVLTKTDPQVDPTTPRYVTQNLYDAKNNLYQITDPRNFLTTFTYDPATNVLLSVGKQIDATTSATTKYEYGDATNPGRPTKVIAPRGNTGPNPDYAYATTLTYDAKGNVLTRLDPDAAKTTYGYDAVGRMTNYVDPDGYATGALASEHTWTIAYDENDQSTSKTDPLGNIVASTFDGAGNLSTATDRQGNVTTYAYDANARLWTVKQKPDPVGNPGLTYTTTMIRDDNGNPTQVTQANNVVTDYVFDALNRTSSFTTHPTAQTNLTTSFVLDGADQPLTRTGADSVVVTYGRDGMSRLTSITAPSLGPISFTYDELGHRKQMIDGTGTTNYQYDGIGRLTQAAGPGGTLNYGYDRDGNPTSLQYPTTETVTYHFTNGGRLDYLDDWATRHTSYAYKPSGLVDSVTLPNTMQTKYGYDRAQRLVFDVSVFGSTTLNRQAYTLDKEGNRTALDEYVAGITAVPTITWSASAQVNAAGTGVQDHPAIAIGADGATYGVWDDARSGNADIYFAKRDPGAGAWGANVKVNTDTGTRIQLNPAIALDSANNAYAVWQDERNGAGKPDIFFRKRTAAGTWVTPDVKVSDESGGAGGSIQRNPRIAGTAAGAQTAVWVDFRSSQKNIYSSQLAVGGTTWGTNLRVTDDTAADKDFPDVVVGADGTAYAVWQDSRNGNADIYYAKLPPGGNTWTTPNVKVSDDPGTTAQTSPRLGIDASGNLIAVWLDARTSPAQIRMSRLASGTSTWSASTAVTSGADRPQSIALAVRTDGKAYLAFDDNRSGNNDVYVREYDPWLNQWAASTLASDDPGSTAQQSPTVAYTSAEVMLGWRDDRSGNADVRARRAALAGGVDHFGYTYDGLNRVTGESGALAETFVLDGASNLSSRTGPNATYTYDTSNRLTGDGGAQPFVWNNADRLATHGSDSFTYDPLGRLTSSTIASTTRDYTYNGDGLLTTRIQGGITTTFAWDAAHTSARLLKVGPDRLVFGLGPIYAVRADNTTATFARDASSNVRAEVSDTGSVTGSYRYRTYGAIAQSTGIGPTYFGFGDLLIDPSGLVYARARWYDPTAGRFLSRDPIAADPGAPSKLNGFNYAKANPLTWGDPSGLDPSRHNALAQVNQRVAYAIAGVFADLDSPDPATRARAVAKVGVFGVVVATATVLGAAAGSEIVESALATPQSAFYTPRAGIYVIGQGMANVTDVAAQVEGTYFSGPYLTPSPTANIVAQLARLYQAIQNNALIIDAGPLIEGVYPSPYYNAETGLIDVLNYTRVFVVR